MRSLPHTGSSVTHIPESQREKNHFKSVNKVTGINFYFPKSQFIFLYLRVPSAQVLKRITTIMFIYQLLWSHVHVSLCQRPKFNSVFKLCLIYENNYSHNEELYLLGRNGV
jgi:hypothetical protein